MSIDKPSTTPALPAVARQALDGGCSLWHAVTKLMAQLHVVSMCQSVAQEQEGTALQGASQKALQLADAELSSTWKAVTAALADWIGHACRLRIALAQSCNTTLLSAVEVVEVATPFLAPDGEMSAADAQRFGLELLLRAQAAAGAHPPDAALVRQLCETGDSFGCHPASQGIDQLESAGELMLEAARALRQADTPWRGAVLAALALRALHQPGFDADPAAAVGALLLHGVPVPARSPFAGH